ncbi:putative enoyl-CoA hydratase echA8 [Roseovarius gaetbuli]|uniref:Putative enoyl-CoA hydratase echA8 n=1 Tax=Roseovarius gaetbuli TaxID=1356575 RepID=A0A1X6Y7W4_9RHOB|nr:enoyl-CoA hydratase-related protein [Roseovarius gaetbuli]SLN12612.1 putative enoyl-CoA hydratase echA8 [Roseovarius gaetbuli]
MYGLSGHAVGGSCELAMMSYIIVAAECACFALPETTIGIIPGAGGTQRLTRVVGKALAMDMVLTGHAMSVEEARAAGLVARVMADGAHVDTAVEMAERIARNSQPIVMMAKEAVNKAYEAHLAEGIHLERRLLYATFAIEYCREGMTAFKEKRPPNFLDR